MLSSPLPRRLVAGLAALVASLALAASTRAAPIPAGGVAFDTRTAKSGAWSDPATWENGKAPKAGDRVQVRPGHVVTYDITPDRCTFALRMVHVGGTLTFSRQVSTKLDVGLLKVQPGDVCGEDGFVCHVEPDLVAQEKKDPSKPGPDLPAAPLAAELLMGEPGNPIPAGVTTTVRLVYFEGMDKETSPAVTSCGARWEVHGAPMSRTWLKLAKPMKPGDVTAVLEEAVTGWRPGDRVILTTSHQVEYEDGNAEGKARGKAVSGTEERFIKSVEGATVTLDAPVKYEHVCSERGRCEVANLSRNVVIESADPDGVRGHTMYHRRSSGSISYAEFRHLGKENVLGKYPVHFHLLRDGLRNGGGIVGASIWDSKNRFMAIHGTDHLLVRDVVGYQCVGHGFFLEDATEQYNVLDRNLAVQALKGKQLKGQVLGFDFNEGAGFWWANGRNTFTRNVACENHKYGFRFEIGKVKGKAPVLSLRQPDGSMADQDVRRIPFLRFEDNESHSEGLYSFFFGDDPAGSVTSDERHPFVVKNVRAWQTHYCLRAGMTHMLVEDFEVYDGAYGVYHPDYNAHVYRNVRLHKVTTEPINRGHDDESIQFGSFTYDGLLLDDCGTAPLIQFTCTAPTNGLFGHFRNVRVNPGKVPTNRLRVVDLGVGPILPDKELDKGVVYFFHDGPGVPSGKQLRVVSIKFPSLMTGGEYESIPGLTGPKVRAAAVDGVRFPKLLDPVDDLPPATVITSVTAKDGKRVVRGVTTDNGVVAKVLVNGQPAKVTSQVPGVADWEATVDATGPVTAAATDDAGNAEKVAASIAAK
ncbi:MAG TPA: G8 domain-containing protein [Humisphaera sp.]